MRSCFLASLCFFLLACNCVAHASSSSSTTSSIAPESSLTISADELYSTLSFVTSYYTGAERLFGKLPHDTAYYNFEKKHIRVQIQTHRKANATGVYDAKGYMLIQFPYWYGGDPPQNDHGRGKAPGSVQFFLQGLWSEKARQLLMVGSASWVVEGKPIILDAVLDLNYTAKNNPTLYTSYISGTLKSLVSENDLGYFDPLTIFSFPTLPNYNYSLLSQAFGSAFSKDLDAQVEQWPSYEGYEYCWVIKRDSIVLELEYAAECREDQHCSPFSTGDGSVGSLPSVLLLTLIQCSAAERKMRYMATFQNTSYDQGFGLNSTVIGEASWDDQNNEFTGIACRLLDPLNRSEDEVGDCTMRLSLSYSTVFTINNDPKLVGRFWSTKNVDKSGYSGKINLTNSDGHGLVTLPSVRYEYTKLDSVRKSCAVKRSVKTGNTYPDVQSDGMSLDLIVENPKGEQFAWAYAAPLGIGDHLYQKKNVISYSEPHNPHSNISYRISLNSAPEFNLTYLFERLNLSANRHNEVEITAEGVYNAENGYLCMVGCRKLVQCVKNSTHTSTDCEILVTLEFAPLAGKRGVRTKGSITSKLAKTDPLYFDDMILYSPSYYDREAAYTIWRMDLEIAMVLISNTFVCIFIALQILHVRRNPEVPSSISLVMLLILSVGHMIPLVLNFEAVHPRELPVEGYIIYGERLVANEVAVRLSSLVALLLQMRLLQLVWTAKQDKNRGEKAGYVMLLLYVAGAVFALLFNSTSHRHVHEEQSSYTPRQHDTVWGGLKSYAGLILDSFLLPQILINGFKVSSERALCSPFYIGISAVRLVPHAYDQYRAQNYPVVNLKKTYYYANPDLGFFFSIGWDIVISFWIVVLVVIVYLQQRRGRRFLLKGLHQLI